MSQPEWRPPQPPYSGQPNYSPPPGWELRPARPRRNLRWLSITSLVLSLLIIAVLSLGGFAALGMVASIIPLIAAIVAVSMDQRTRPLAWAALGVSLLPLVIYAFRIASLLGQ